MDTVESIEGETIVPAEYKDALQEHLKKLPYVFQIVLLHGRRTGHYIRENTWSKWQPQEEYAAEKGD